jgi:hypothetical protein
MEKVKVSKKSFGYDLSAATDRLPIDIQVSVLKGFFGPLLAEKWKDLLVGREYILDNQHKLSYAVGQPMGALSS